jgi:hypothetical protein
VSEDIELVDQGPDPTSDAYEGGGTSVTYLDLSAGRACEFWYRKGLLKGVGDWSHRQVITHRVRYGTTPHHPKPCLLLECYDLDAQALRTFALGDVSPVPPEALERPLKG